MNNANTERNPLEKRQYLNFLIDAFRQTGHAHHAREIVFQCETNPWLFDQIPVDVYHLARKAAGLSGLKGWE